MRKVYEAQRMRELGKELEGTPNLEADQTFKVLDEPSITMATALRMSSTFMTFDEIRPRRRRMIR